MANQFTDKWTDKEIEQLKDYVSKGLSNKEIASKLNRSSKSVSVKKNRLGLKNEREYLKFNDKEWLYQKYVVEELSTTDISELAGVQFSTIARWLQKYGIQARDFYEKTERHKQKIGLKMKEYTMENHNSWKGGKTSTNEGYVYVKTKSHPYSNANGAVLEHRLVMEKFLGRFLTPIEVVHHLNEIKNDNRIENLFLFASAKDHNHFHGKRLKNPNFPMLYKYDYLYQEETAI